MFFIRKIVSTGVIATVSGMRGIVSTTDESCAFKIEEGATDQNRIKTQEKVRTKFLLMSCKIVHKVNIKQQKTHPIGI